MTEVRCRRGRDALGIVRRHLAWAGDRGEKHGRVGVVDRYDHFTVAAEAEPRWARRPRAVAKTALTPGRAEVDALVGILPDGTARNEDAPRMCRPGCERQKDGDHNERTEEQRKPEF